MTRLSHLLATFVVAATTTIQDVSSVSISSDGITTIQIGMEPNYPPYATLDDNGAPSGFGTDFAYGLNDLCPNLNVEVVETTWAECWSDDDGGTLGPSVENGSLDGCMTYIHTHVRDEVAEFSGAMLDDNKAVGLLTHLNENGLPHVTGMDDMAGKIIIDVAGWAPSPEAFQFVTNQCTGERFSKDVTIISAEVDELHSNPNDVAMRMLHENKGDAIFTMTDVGSKYGNTVCPDDAVWDCELWKGFGTRHAFVQTGQFGYTVNGTSFAMAKKGSGIKKLLEPCMTQFMASKGYYDLCSKYDVLDACYRNEYFDEMTKAKLVYDRPTNEQYGDCGDGYCPCSAGSVVEAAAADGGDDDAGSLPIWAIIVIVVGSVLAIALLAGGIKLRQKKKEERLEQNRQEEQAEALKRKVLHGGSQSENALHVDGRTVYSGSSAKGSSAK